MFEQECAPCLGRSTIRDGVERVMMVFICKMIFYSTRMPKLLAIVLILRFAFSFFEVKDVTMLFGDG